jgi:uncharacterized protein
MSKKHRHKKKHRQQVGYQEPSAYHCQEESPGTMCVTVHGTHCASCEVLIERKFKRIEGIDSVKVNHATGRVDVEYSHRPHLNQLQEALEGTEYTVTSFQQKPGEKKTAVHKTTAQDYKETFWVFLIVMGAYLILSKFRLIPEGLSVGENMSYGFVFLIGLIAAVSSCIAVTGGLLLAVAGRYAEVHPEMEGIKRFRPHLYFNAGRVIGYTVFGGLVGAVGSVFTLSTRMTGVMTIAASLIMVFLGFQLLNIFPQLRRFQPKMPKFIAHRVHDASSSSDHPAAPFGLGAATFFLPCGFTQALQLYVLSQGSFTVGALTMFFFSLGTLPALMSLSALSSFLKGATQRHFFRFAGVVVVLLGLSNIGNGLALAGTNISMGTILANTTASDQATAASDLPPIENGKQVITMKVKGYQYEPAKFSVRQGVPVEWRIDGSQAAGCARSLIADGFDISAVLPRSGTKTVEFTPDKTGAFPFSCSMGMTTRGAAITVVANTDATASATPLNYTPASPVPTTSSAPAAASGEVQKLNMTVTYEQGFYPNTFKVKKGIPVILEIDVQADVSGCMDTVVGSDYDIGQRLKMGKNQIKFTPTKTGELNLTCPMGVPVADITIS